MTSSIRRTDVLALGNLREDGRKPGEIRRMRIQLGPLDAQQATGSALVEMGLTSVLATVRGPMECRSRAEELVDRAILQVTVQSTPFSTADRRVTNPSTDRRLIEASTVLQRALEAAVLLHLYPKSKIEVVVCILADDGGKLPAAINAASLALVDAGVAVKDLLCACSAGFSSSSTTLVDLNRREEASSGGQPAVNLPVAILPQRGTIVLAQCEARLPDFASLERVLEAGMEGCRTIFDIMQAAVRERASILLGAQNGRLHIEKAF